VPKADILVTFPVSAGGLILFSDPEAPMSINQPDALNEKDAIHKVFEEYYDVYGQDSVAASAFYGEPTLVILQNEIVVLSTRADVAAFFDKYVASLKLSGYSHSRVGDYRVKSLNSTTALFSTIPIRMKTDGTEMQRSGFTYLLLKGDAGWRIHGFLATDIDKLIDAD